MKFQLELEDRIRFLRPPPWLVADVASPPTATDSRTSCADHSERSAAVERFWKLWSLSFSLFPWQYTMAVSGVRSIEGAGSEGWDWLEPEDFIANAFSFLIFSLQFNKLIDTKWK